MEPSIAFLEIIGSGVGVSVGSGEAVAVAEAVAEGLTDGFCDGAAEVSEGFADGVCDGAAEGFCDGTTAGVPEGAADVPEPPFGTEEEVCTGAAVPLFAGADETSAAGTVEELLVFPDFFTVILQERV